MGIFRRNTTLDCSYYASTSEEVADRGLGRCEAEVFAPRAIATDSYEAWLEQREADAQREAPQIRWSYTYRPADRGDAEDGMVTA